MSDRPPKAPQRGVILPQRPNSTPLTSLVAGEHRGAGQIGRLGVGLLDLEDRRRSADRLLSRIPLRAELDVAASFPAAAPGC